MTIFIPWLLGAALIIFVAFFLWSRLSKKNQKPTPAKTLQRPVFDYETAEELAPAPPLITKEPTPELPNFYGLDRLLLLVRDPQWLYAYWEITATKIDEFTNTYGEDAWHHSKAVLRVYDVTGIDFNGSNANDFHDIEIAHHANNWYFDVEKPDSSFCVDLGRILPNGQFVTLIRSNIVTTPRNSLSNCFDEEWMWIGEVYQSILIQMGLSSAILVEELSRKSHILPLGISSLCQNKNH